MSVKAQVVIGLALLALGAYIGRATVVPAEQTSIEQTDKEQIKKDIKTVTKETRNKDGSVVIETVVVDKSKEKKSTVTVFEQTKLEKTDWFLQVTADSVRLVESPVYGLSVNRRVLGPLYLGISAKTDRTVGASVGIEW